MSKQFDTRLIIRRSPDGTYTRTLKAPTTPAVCDSSSPVLSKDVPINSRKNTTARIFRPRSAAGGDNKNLPLIIYLHGGGFVTCSPATTSFHKLCSEMAGRLRAVVVSVGYRLAPENRLPAAYDDAVEAIHWVRKSTDSWLTVADLSNCFLMGSSAGGNIAYHAALRAAVDDDLQPLKIRGLIFHHPYFGGVKRSESEVRLVDDGNLPLVVNDLMWECSLPVGTDRDHPYANHRSPSELRDKALERVRFLRWKVMVTGCDGDPLISRQMDFAKMLRDGGVAVVEKFDGGGQHTVEFVDKDRNEKFLELLNTFVNYDDSRSSLSSRL